MGHALPGIQISREQEKIDNLREALEASLDKVSNLELALEHSRDIGAAMGILMATHKVTREVAFDLLRRTSQNCNVKVHAIALEVVEQGCIPERYLNGAMTGNSQGPRTTPEA